MTRTDLALHARHVTIVGGGIGGLTAALALAQRGARVTVLERAGQFREVGAGIQISPNALRVLSALGIGDRITEISAPSRGVELRAGRTGALVARIDYARHRPAAPFRVIHRSRLIEALARAER